ncbi:MAG: hypothetical protein NC400_02980 [Clostridium sp.]|nr:hypothetical protein [Clostridium sp.]
MAQHTAGKNAPEANTQQKIQTKYDRKMEARKQQKLKEARQDKITKITALAVCALVVLAAVISVAATLIRRNTALNGTYVTVGAHDLSQLEYDYYYHSAVNNYLTTYSSILPYMGLDTSTDFDEQQYSEDMTWKDMFDEMTVEQIKQTRVMVKEAGEKGFAHDDAEEYADFTSQLQTYADNAGVSIKEYYKQSFGDFATPKNIEPFVRENILASAYYNHLIEENAASDEEVAAYYEEHKQDYDKVDYRSFIFTAELAEDADEDAVSSAMDELKKEADAMMKARQEGEDFEALCLENADEDAKSNYEDAESEYSLTEGRYYAGTSSIMADWLYEDGRKEGDITVLEDESNHQYYVVEFVKRYFDEADNENIADTIASSRASEYMAGLVENCQVVDVKGELKYLTLDRTSAETDEEADDASEGEATDDVSAGEETGDVAGEEADDVSAAED